MPRRSRCVLDGVLHHVTRRGGDLCPVFVTDCDRQTYLHLLTDNLPKAHVRPLGWYLMTNDVHLIILPEAADWAGYLQQVESNWELEKCSYAGSPFGDPSFVCPPFHPCFPPPQTSLLASEST